MHSRSGGSDHQVMVWPSRPELFHYLLAGSNSRSAALWPPLAYNPVRYSMDSRPDHGDRCICRELGRYSTNKLGLLLLAMRLPNCVLAAKCSERWMGLRSPVSCAKPMTSDEAMVFDKVSVMPTDKSSKYRMRS